MNFRCQYWYFLGILLVLALVLALIELLEPEVAIAPTDPIMTSTKTPQEPNAFNESESLDSLNALPDNSINLLNTQSELALDQTATLGWNFSGLPSEAGLVLNLRRAVPDSDRFKYNGATGPITLQPLEVGNGKGSITWQVSQVGCAPTDSPTWCEVQPGAYYLEGTVYDQANFLILGKFMPPDPSPQKLRTYKTKVFEITGQADLSVLETELYGAAINRFVKTFALDQGGGIFTARDFVKIDETWYEEAALNCLNFSISEPFSGKLKACGNPLKRNEVQLQVLNPLTVDPSIRDYKTAKSLAQDRATEPYWSRVTFRTQPSPAEAGYPGWQVIDFPEWSRQNPEATTYLSYSLRDWDIKNKDWLFHYQVNKAGGSEEGEDRFNESVWVKVPPSGLACRVVMGPRNKVSFDPEKDKAICL